MHLSAPLHKLITVVALGWISVSSAQAQVLYSTPGGTYSQNFNSLGTSNFAWNNNTVIGGGWYGLRQDGLNPTTAQAASGSASNIGPLLNTGTTSDADRSLGAQTGLTGNTTPFLYGVRIANNTGSSLSQFTLTYDGEQWRMVLNDITDVLTVQYQIFPSGSGSIDAASGWNTVPSLTFNAPQTTTSASAALDGNAPANRSAGLNATISSLSWANTEDLWIRWSDAAASNQRAMMGIDNISFTAVPEPSATLFLALGALACCLLRRRSSR